jgi:hypothetical protein
MRPEIHPEIEGLEPNGGNEIIGQGLVAVAIGFWYFPPKILLWGHSLNPSWLGLLHALLYKIKQRKLLCMTRK